MPRLHIALRRQLHATHCGDFAHPPRIYPGRYLAAFLDGSAAEAFRDEQERRGRRSGDLGDLFALAYEADDPWAWLLEQTEFDEPVFLDWLADAGIPRPPDEGTDPEDHVPAVAKWLE